MISRRNIRINVMLTIYEQIQQNVSIQKEEAQKSLDETFHQTSSLFSTVWHFVILLSEYILVYANQKASKHRPSEADLNINIKLAQNQIITELKQNTSLTENIKKNKLSNLFDIEFIRQIFYDFIETETYKKYILEKEQTLESDIHIINFMLQYCIYDNDITSSFLEEKFINYDIDIESIKSWTEKVVKNPKRFNFGKIISSEKLEYAQDLLNVYINKKEIIAAIIEPKLIGWDVERVAILDRIILHLGISEMLFFPSIPLKVTINEYIDLAKGYSTLQSGQFVNGLLDNVKNEFEKENKIIKNDYIKREKK